MQGGLGLAAPALKLDQAQTHFSGGLSVANQPNQTLVAGLHGKLIRVDVPLCTPTAGSRMHLTIAQVDPPKKSSSAVIAFATSYSDCAWYSLTLGRSLRVKPGTKLRLALGVDAGGAPLWGSNAGANDPYPAGVGTWSGHTINDFAFRTYIDAAAG